MQISFLAFMSENDFRIMPETRKFGFKNSLKIIFIHLIKFQLYPLNAVTFTLP